MAFRMAQASALARLSRMWWAGLRAQAIARVKPHALPLALVLLACALGQATSLNQRPLVFLWPDSSQYLSLAQRMLAAHHFIDPLRTPGYPTFLALIFAVTRGQHLGAVVAIQAILTIITTVEVYVLACWISVRRWTSAVIAAMLGINPFVVTSERLILTEALSYWLIVTLLLVFAQYLRGEHSRTLLWLALVSIAVIMVRPQFIYLPAMLGALLALRNARLGRLGQRWKRLALVVALVYGLVLAYMAGNAVLNSYFGLSNIANLNLFGKVLEYRMYDLPAAGDDPRLDQFQADVKGYIASDHQELRGGVSAEMLTSRVWQFVHTHRKYDADNWAIYGTYSGRLIEHHPIYYLEHSSSDVLACWNAGVQPWAPITYVPAWLDMLWLYAAFAARTYVFLPILLVVMAFQAWRHPEQVSRFALFALVLTAASNILMSALTDFTEFSRLRFPVDWAVTLVFVVALVDLTQALARAAAAQRHKMRVAGAQRFDSVVTSSPMVPRDVARIDSHGSKARGKGRERA